MLHPILAAEKASVGIQVIPKIQALTGSITHQNSSSTAPRQRSTMVCKKQPCQCHNKFRLTGSAHVHCAPVPLPTLSGYLSADFIMCAE